MSKRKTVQIISMIWGYVLHAPRRPTVKKQLEALQSHGVDTGRRNAVWTDRLERIPRGRGVRTMILEGRNDLLNALVEGDSVVVADPYCVGISREDASAFIAELSAHGVSLVVGDRIYRVDPGSDASDLMTAIWNRYNSTYVANYRARRTKRRKPKRKS